MSAEIKKVVVDKNIRREDLLLQLAENVNNESAIETLLSVAHEKLDQKDDLYNLALNNEHAALYIAKSLELREKISPKRWRLLISLHGSLALYAFSSEAKWKVCDDIPASNMVLMAKDNPQLAMAIFDRFSEKKGSGFFGLRPKLNTAQWKEIAMYPGEAGQKIVLSHLGHHFNAKDLLEIASANSLTATAIQASHSGKLNQAQQEELQGYVDRATPLVKTDVAEQMSSSPVSRSS